MLKKQKKYDLEIWLPEKATSQDVIETSERINPETPCYTPTLNSDQKAEAPEPDEQETLVYYYAQQTLNWRRARVSCGPELIQSNSGRVERQDDSGLFGKSYIRLLTITRVCSTNMWSLQKVDERRRLVDLCPTCVNRALAILYRVCYTEL